MGDYAGFVARVKKGEKATELKRKLEEEGGGKELFADDDLGLVIGILKASYPGGCMVELIRNDLIETFAVLAERANVDMGNFDYKE